MTATAVFHPHAATTAIPPLELDPTADTRLALLEHVAHHEGDRPGLDVTVNPENTDGCVWVGPHSADLGWRIVIGGDV